MTKPKAKTTKTQSQGEKNAKGMKTHRLQERPVGAELGQRLGYVGDRALPPRRRRLGEAHHGTDPSKLAGHPIHVAQRTERQDAAAARLA